jgi:hypothetical protein
MNAQPVTCRRVASMELVKEAGDFFITKPGPTGVASLLIRLPPGDAIHGLPITLNLVSDPGRGWAWDGNLDAPTLDRPIHHPGAWHGHLTGGKLVPL